MEQSLQQIGAVTAPDELQRNVRKLLLETSDKYSNYAMWLNNNHASVAQLALIALIVNEGLVLMNCNSETSTEATHLEHFIEPEHLAGINTACEQNLTDDLSSFEKELDALTLDTPADDTGYDDDGGAARAILAE